MALKVVEREPQQVAIDRFLVLCVLDTVEHAGGTSPGKTLLQKIFFQARLALSRLGFNEPHYHYRRHLYGPFSPELSEDLEGLQGRKLVTSNNLVSQRGRDIVRAFRPHIELRNPDLFKRLDTEAKKRAKWTAKQAKAEAYSIPVMFTQPSGEARTLSIKELRQGVAFALEPSTIRELDLEQDVLWQLAADLSMTVGDVRAAHRFSAEHTRGVHALLDS